MADKTEEIKVENPKVKPDGPQAGLTLEEQLTGVKEVVGKGEPDMRPGNRGVPSKSLLEEHPQTHPGALSPGQYAEEVVGYSDAPVDSDEAQKHADKFVEAKTRRRRG